MSDLAAALLDVRRATRLLYAYQRRVNDLFALVAEELSNHGVAFAGWYTMGHLMPPKRSTVFYAGRWASDMMPGARLAAQFSGVDAAGAPISVHLQVLADSGFEEVEAGGEPDAAAFPPAEECDSELRWSVVRGSQPGMALGGAWDALRAAHGDALNDGTFHTAEYSGGQVSRWFGHVSLTALGDADAVRVKVISPMVRAIKEG